MATNPTSPQTARPSWLTWMAERPRETAQALFGLSGVLLIITLWLGFRFRAQYWQVTVWVGLLALLCAGLGLWRFSARPARLSAEEVTRLLLLLLAGAAGVLTVAVLGVGLSYINWDVLTGGWETWQKERLRFWLCILAFAFGLGLMFLGLIAGRTDPHAGAIFRRTVYAYNVFLSGWILLLILVLVNLLCYVPVRGVSLNESYYWAASSIYSLSPQSVSILENLDKPLRIYAVIDQGDPYYHDLRALLDNFRSVNSAVQVKYLSPTTDREELERLAKDYKFGGERKGVLVVYGPEGKAEGRFVRYDDLLSTAAVDPDPRAQRQLSFRGEAALMTEVKFLSEGQQKPVVYFTQGNGELDINDTQPARDYDKGAGELRTLLEGANYTVKGLMLTSAEGIKGDVPNTVLSTRVPADASLVVIAGPRQALTAPALQALRAYADPPGNDPNQKKGKLIILLDVNTAPDGTMQKTGLEPFLAEHGVQVGDDLILHDPRSNGEPVDVVRAATAPTLGNVQNPLTETFARFSFPLVRARSVRPVPVNRPEGSRYRAESFMAVSPRWGTWVETNLRAGPQTLWTEYRNRNELGKKFSANPVPVAVVVNEMSPGAGGGPHAMLQGEEKPRMLVFGDATFLSNALMNNPNGSFIYDFFESCIAWLREKPASIGIEAKKRDFYTFNADYNWGRLVGLPALFMLLGVLGLGAGVWVVRRR